MTCWMSRYEAEGYVSAIDWTVDHLSPEDLEKWWWSDRPNDADATCLLPAGHTGPHVWTPDDEIVVYFK